MLHKLSNLSICFVEAKPLQVGIFMRIVGHLDMDASPTAGGSLKPRGFNASANGKTPVFPTPFPYP